MTWMKPEMVEIKMDAEISSYQGDDYDPLKDGPPVIRGSHVAQRPEETQGERVLTRV